MDKEKKRRTAYDVMIFLGVLALIMFITRLWPILLLVIVGILICALHLLFVSVKQPMLPMPPPILPALPAPETEKEIIQKAFGLLQRRITEQVMIEYPNARWVWSNPKAMESFAEGNHLTILLNSAGGYQKAHVLAKNLIFSGLSYVGPDGIGSSAAPQTETVVTESHSPIEDTDDDLADEPVVINYERLAFEWVESYLMEINSRCNEAIATEQSSVLLPSCELPHPDSWLDVCKELRHNGFPDADVSEVGITLTLPQ